jgi:hypothetical protein
VTDESEDAVRLCAFGDPEIGEAPTVLGCFTRLVVANDDGRAICSDSCFYDESCPFGMLCGYTTCTCTVDIDGYCTEFTCTPSTAENPEEDPDSFPACIPADGYGSTCTSDLDCPALDYCGPDATCRPDDRAGCNMCASCTTDTDCGRGVDCLRTDPAAATGVCTQACTVDTECPGNTVCGVVAFPLFGAAAQDIQVCVPASAASIEAACAGFTCAVSCRDDVACPDGQRCESGACVAATADARPIPPAPAITVLAGSGVASCAASSTSLNAAWCALLLALVVLRKRR